MNRPILGESKAVKELMSLIDRVSASKTNVLIIGESGTGKELIARHIHYQGPLAAGPFIPVNCGAITETLIESEMFGHRRGSFTGAIAEKQGLFEAAQGGTLFLDEVGELPLAMQVKLLRALQEKTIRKVGGTEDIHVDARIIAATNRDLEAAIQKGTFREDLYYRLNVIQLKAPTLRERKGDITVLAEHFLKRFAESHKRGVMKFSKEVLSAFENYRWPGNIRELENVLERAVTLSSGTTLDLDCLMDEIAACATQTPAPPVKKQGKFETTTSGTEDAAGMIRVPQPDFSRGAVNLESILGEIEKAYILKALEQSGGVKKKAAELLGLTFRSIRYRLTKLGMDAGDEGE